MKRKNRAASASTTPPEGKKKKVTSASDPESSTSAAEAIDYTSSQRVVESLLGVVDLESFFEETWEKKPHFVKREKGDFYGSLFSKKDLESVLKKEELQFIEDIGLSRYVEGKTELLNEEGRVNLKHIKAAGVAVHFHEPDRFKDEVWRLIESLETYFRCLVAADAFVFQPGSQGLAPQFDEMETFILQLEGKTKWKLFKPLQELPQEASPDLELSDLGEPTDEFDMEPGDLLYFPRGTVYFPAPIEDKDHAVYLAITTFQENSWGNLLTSALSKAVDKAMESDVEYRRGLPVNLASFMGSGVIGNETEDPFEQNGDQKMDEEETAEEKKAGNPRTTFNTTLVNLMKGLVQHLNPDKAVDEMLHDFFGGRLPPYGKGVKKGKKKSAPSDKSKIKLLHPDHVRVLIGDLSEGVAETDESDEEMSEAEEEAEEEESEEASEESEKENEKDSKKGAKKQKVKKTEKAKKTKTKSKRAKSEDDAEEDEDNEEEDDDDEEGNGSENEGFENEEGGDEYILVLHSVNNNRASHMMGDKNPCSILKFPFRYKDALRQITSEPEKFIAVNSLQLAEKERLSLVGSLWDEGLLDIE